MVPENEGELEVLPIKHSEAEKVIEDCNAALELIPLRELEQGQTWVPSEVAIYLLKKAKESVSNYIITHTDNGN